MTDPNLVRFLQRQTSRRVGLIPHSIVRQGSDRIAASFEEAAARDESIVVVDALTDDDLRSIGQAAAGLKLITGGSGIALGLPRNFQSEGRLSPQKESLALTAAHGPAVMLAGSCSAATLRQIDFAIKAGTPALKIDPFDIAAGKLTTDHIVAWVKSKGNAIPLVYSTSDPNEVGRVQLGLGRELAGELVEHLMGNVAAALKQEGYRKFVVAGGETSGAVVNGLGIKALRIGPEIDPGVPWTFSLGDEKPIALALKSGNFGADNFLVKAWSIFDDINTL